MEVNHKNVVVKVNVALFAELDHGLHYLSEVILSIEVSVVVHERVQH